MVGWIVLVDGLVVAVDIPLHLWRPD
jgi:hypothetical protein